ncbi:unnamed protein product [Haemonchus placei]|uniref:Non-specific serine/threonine protein kinase n=1 Tax=Haemonchus placei TaxID=6290 RepID=A0A158QKW4_HAEPC|nr:unnamed protein product [Haemonchus placei]
MRNYFAKLQYTFRKNAKQLRELSLDELLRRKNNLESEMDEELRDLQRRYQAKRQPILDVIAAKKRRNAN